MNIEASVDVTLLSPQAKQAGRYKVGKIIPPKTKTPLKV
jgi:hypothetical protein